MTDHAKLKPCPFCGAPDPEHGGNFVQCRHCGGESYIENARIGDMKEAAKRWNMRAALGNVDQTEVNIALEAAATALDEAAAAIRARKTDDD